MMRKSSALPCYLHMTSPEASAAQNKKGKQIKGQIKQGPRVLHLKAELQDGDTFQRAISGKGHIVCI